MESVYLAKEQSLNVVELAYLRGLSTPLVAKQTHDATGRVFSTLKLSACS
ncbi:hypothetical protein M378DRAFT_165855 [Amanita muscaria Koide BX008]|uniref:Uncharacterized protein n=1 Tax=Amanita muscaria (strain Koide BX008) TaxID=946122 RepID=A0A0C2WZL8_AMAMK|nr:hypothetical protein M378DRAFT_165855 [Amanita muscaria Koide BX008]